MESCNTYGFFSSNFFRFSIVSVRAAATLYLQVALVFFFTAVWNSILYILKCVSSSVADALVSYFQFLAIKANASMSMCINMSVHLYVHVCLEVESLGLRAHICSALWILPNSVDTFQSGCKNIHSCRQCLRIPVILYLHQHFVVSILGIYFILLFLFSYLGVFSSAYWWFQWVFH